MLKQKAEGYVKANLIQREMAERVIKVIESERLDDSYINDEAIAGADDASTSSLTTRLSHKQLEDLLTKRVEMMKKGQVRDDDGGHDIGVTDQYRVYSEIIDCIQQGKLLRLLVQASAGTGVQGGCNP